MFLFFLFGPDYNFPEKANSIDLDIFLYDKEKIIHISTAGMSLINSLITITEDSSIKNLKKVLSYRRLFSYQTNTVFERDNLTSRENYTRFFQLMAKRGFYSYDRVNIDNPEDYTFQLIAKPETKRKLIINNIELGDESFTEEFRYDLDFIQAKKKFPVHFNNFDIREYV